MKDIMKNLMKEANQKKIFKRRQKKSWSMFKGAGLAAMTGIGIYGLAKNRHLLSEIADLALKNTGDGNTGGLQQCINQCKGTIKELESLSGTTNDIEMKSTLEESGHHLRMCLHECEFALSQVP